MASKRILPFLISDFHRIPNVLFFLSGDSAASEFYVPTFRNTVCFVFIGGVSSFLLLSVMEVELTGCSKTSAHKIQTQGNHPKEKI